MCYPTLLYGHILLVILRNVPSYSVISHSSVIWNSRVYHPYISVGVLRNPFQISEQSVFLTSFSVLPKLLHEDILHIWISNVPPECCWAQEAYGLTEFIKEATAHWPLIMPHGYIELGQHCLRTPSHYLNQCWQLTYHQYHPVAFAWGQFY